MRSCPACGEFYTRQFRMIGTGLIHYIHAGADCVVSDPEKFSSEQLEGIAVKQLRERNQSLFEFIQKREEHIKALEAQVQSLTKIALNQNYLEEKNNDEILNRIRAGGHVPRLDSKSDRCECCIAGNCETAPSLTHGHADSGANKD